MIRISKMESLVGKEDRGIERVSKEMMENPRL